MRGSLAIVWLWEKNPWKGRHMPYLPEERPRPLTASSECQGSKESQLFTKLPREIRLEILRQAFGDQDVHVELDYDYPPVMEKPPTDRHAARVGVHYFEAWRDRTRVRGGWSKYGLKLNKGKPRKWRWWSCVCHRWPLGGPFKGLDPMGENDPSQDKCKSGFNDNCKDAPGSVPLKCHVGAMGWLLCCRQAYREGIHVLYTTSAFLFGNTELILSLPRLLLPSRLESMTRVEMLWRIHPFRGQGKLDPPLSDLDSFLTLAKAAPEIFPNLQMLYVSLLGDMYAVKGDTRVPENYTTERVYNKVEEVIMKPVEDMIRRFAHLEACIIALPSSCYGAEKQHAMANGGRVLEERTHLVERIWRELEDGASLGGYWLQLGHRDMGDIPWFDPFAPWGEREERVPQPMDVLYTLFSHSPWGDKGGSKLVL